jgi:hypothetical protein
MPVACAMRGVWNCTRDNIQLMLQRSVEQLCLAAAPVGFAGSCCIVLAVVVTALE